MMICTNEFVGQPVRSLQTMLRVISNHDSQVLPVIPDGIYSSDTMESIASFQKRYNLPVTGETDIETWYKVADEYRNALIEIGPAEVVNPVLQRNQAIRRGEVNQHLYMIHGMLMAISDRYESMPRASCNNVHDDLSVSAIQWLQTRADIEPTGEINKLTWKHLSRLYRITVGDGTDFLSI